MLFDTDPQASATWWGDQRAEREKQHPPKTPLDVRFVAAVQLGKHLQQAEADGYDFAIIDTPPTDTNEAKTAAELADLILVPVEPGVFDFIALKRTLGVVQANPDFTFAIMNCANHITPKLTEEAEAIVSQRMRLAPVTIHRRTDYLRAVGQGMAAPEMKPGDKHAEEIDALWRWLMTTMPVAAARTKTQTDTATRPVADETNLAGLERSRRFRGGA